MKINGQVSTNEATKMMSFCSVSGPMFIIGTVGIMMLNSLKAGIIILISNILASLANGLVYRGKEKPLLKASYTAQKRISLTDSVYDSLISVLMVGAYISISFLFIEILTSLGIIKLFSNTLCCVFNLKDCQNIVASSLIGILEITSGISSLSTTSASIIVKTILASCLIGFGGVSVLLQSINFVSRLNIPLSTIIRQKFTQAIFCVIFSSILSFALF